MLQSIQIRGYRSLRNFRLTLGRLTVVTGANGVGKSNLYRALALLQRMADGQLAEALALEGGMPGALWAGEWKKQERRRIQWLVRHEDFEFESEAGLVPTEPGERTCFRTDPDIKEERLLHAGGVLMAERKGPTVSLRSEKGMTRSPLPLHRTESMLSAVRDGLRFPALAAVREALLGWRFYHHFRMDADSPMRREQVGFWSPVLAHDGSNLAATLQSILESGREMRLLQHLEEAFSGASLHTVTSTGRFLLQLEKPEFKRAFDASELSDGTLRYLCLAAALLTDRPPPLLVLNEPETSLHPGLIEPLAGLIAGVDETTQILVVTHSQELAARIAEKCEVETTELIQFRGETRHLGEDGPGRVWNFD